MKITIFFLILFIVLSNEADINITPNRKYINQVYIVDKISS